MGVWEISASGAARSYYHLSGCLYPCTGIVYTAPTSYFPFSHKACHGILAALSIALVFLFSWVAGWEVCLQAAVCCANAFALFHLQQLHTGMDVECRISGITICCQIKICLRKGTPPAFSSIAKATVPDPRTEGTSTPLPSAAPSSSSIPARYFPQCCSRSPSPTARSSRTRRTRLTASLARGCGRLAVRFVW